MKNWIINTILSITAVFFIALFFLVLFVPPADRNVMIITLDIITFLLSLTCMILNCNTVKRAYTVFAGLLVCLCTFGIFLMRTGAVRGNIYNWWPVLGIFSGISLYFSGLYKYRKNRFGFLIPSVVLVICGIWFLLFSWKIITVPFIQVVLISGPLLLIMGFVIVFVMFHFQHKIKEYILEEDEDSLFDDDDIIPEKNS